LSLLLFFNKMDPIDAVKVEIHVLEHSNALLVKSTKRLSRSKTAVKTLDSIEAFTANCLRLTELNTELRRLIALKALRSKELRDLASMTKRADDLAFSALCDAIEPKWPIGDMFVL
jgi:hypothetical protein